jgi:hypothetical protein
MNADDLEPIEWNTDELRRHGFALIDASSVRKLLEPQSRGSSKKTSRGSKRILLADTGERLAKTPDDTDRAILDTLAQFVAYNHLCVERLALESLGPLRDDLDDATKKLLKSLKVTLIPEDRLKAAFDRAVVGVEGFLSASRTKVTDWPEVYNNADKDFFAFVAKECSHAVDVTLANSTESSALRALMYAELQRDAMVPVILGRKRLALLEWHADTVCDLVSDRIAAEAKKTLKDSISVEVPSLQNLILNTAIERGCSWTEAAIEIKDSRNAQDFRQWLYPLQKNLIDGTVGRDPESRRDFEQGIAKLRTVMESWARLGPGEGTKYRTRQIPLKAKVLALPLVIALTLALGGKVDPALAMLVTGIQVGPEVDWKLTIKDPLLGIRRHLEFVESWSNWKAV